mmetsp:Transcript_13578/g.57092  ORF Transcript_13578/g.57092 Transcript_13578/m.57092 type:complete len:206 (+) Transcript_13578:1972-2589(+)
MRPRRRCRRRRRRSRWESTFLIRPRRRKRARRWIRLIRRRPSVGSTRFRTTTTNPTNPTRVARHSQKKKHRPRILSTTATDRRTSRGRTSSRDTRRDSRHSRFARGAPRERRSTPPGRAGGTKSTCARARAVCRPRRSSTGSASPSEARGRQTRGPPSAAPRSPRRPARNPAKSERPKSGTARDALTPAFLRPRRRLKCCSGVNL